MIAAFGQVPGLAASHILLAAAALVLALAISLPLGVFAARRPVLRQAALGFASLVQTVPGLALLALFYPVLVGLSALVGGGIPALGFLPSLLALTLYALLPILRNVITGLGGIDPAVIEAADGIGMTPAQRLRLVEAPLAAPVAMAGIRTAAVWTIGAATLSTTVGYPSLGNLIFAGLQTETTALVLAGCVASAALALAVDGLLALVERGVATGRRWLMAGPALLLLAVVGGAAAYTWWPAKPAIVIGAKNFSEQYILARLIGDRLQQAGFDVRYREGLGSALALRALEGGDVDVYVDYAGTIWTNAMQRTDTPAAPAMAAGIDGWLQARPGRARVIGPLGFENAYALAMKPRAGVASIADLARVAPGLRLAADLEFLDRPEWRTIRDAYGLRFADQRAYSPTFMYRALSGGQADVISAFSSDGRIAADGLVVLADPKRAVPSYDALLLVGGARAGDARVRAALQPLVGRVPVAAMRQANYMVDRDADKATPEVAARWLAGQLGRTGAQKPAIR
ncbi:ABC transporter permease/substrate-binding protein [Sphingomonas prati]|uniref:Osmoprotectant transport system permease protein n=1 Tax=Sphingomonas prati TaxID=1843237 RepID=A0A7W9BQG3_9SPHN|nr:ABC transporter permease/substrate-binding protein [Sphingomonas prati]MBB5728110.1 osmoprotectant transport system permease protein [Sphingomonas prati]GGE83348.1 ABC transporter permease [Sphingomonas prati]